MSDSVQTTSLNDKWALYHHLPSSPNWTLSGYEVVYTNIDTVNKAVSIYEAISENTIKFSMWFLMKSNISPVWEDPNNKCGGNISYKVMNKFVPEVWKQLFFMICGGTLCKNPNNNQYLNGITISPKKNFCIIKIWLNRIIHDITIISEIPNLANHGAAFNIHGDSKN